MLERMFDNENTLALTKKYYRKKLKTINNKIQYMINIFKSKFILFIVGILILCLILIGHVYLSDSISDSNSNLNGSSDDVVYIWIEDEDGNIKLTPTTDTHAEFSASAPG